MYLPSDAAPGADRHTSWNVAIGKGHKDSLITNVLPHATRSLVSVRFRGQAADSGRIDSSSGCGPTTSAWHIEASTSLGFKLGIVLDRSNGDGSLPKCTLVKVGVVDVTTGGAHQWQQ